MKPRNFPGRKNERRKRALARMKPGADAYEVTRLRIVPDATARNVRTKKDRSAFAKLRSA